MTTTRVGAGQISPGITVDVGDFLIVSAGGTADATVVNSGGQVYLSSGGSTSGTVLHDGGYEYVSSGGTTSLTTVSDGGFEVVYTGGTASGTVLSRGGEEAVYSGGTSINAVVNSGIQLVYNSGTADGTTLVNNGLETVYAGGSASDTVVGSAGVQIVSAAGTASGTTIGSDGSELVASGGTVVGTTVNSGGFLLVSAGGNASGTTVDSGGFLAVLPGGSASGTTGVTASTGVLVTQAGGGVVEDEPVVSGLVISPDGAEYIFADGSATSSVVSDGGSEYVYTGGAAGGTVVGNDGQVFVSSGGTTSGTAVNNRGNEFVYSSGTASDTVVNNGGKDFVFAGGSAVAAVVGSGGAMTVSPGGTATGAELTGGFEFVYGTAISTLANSGGVGVLPGGSASNTVIGSSGKEYVYSGGSIAGATINGGSLVFQSASEADRGAIAFAGPGALTISAGTPANTIAGFVNGDSVDFVALSPASVNSTQIGGNTQVGGVTFAGSFPATGPGAFGIGPDGGGGTLVTVAPCFAAGTRIQAQSGGVPVEQLSVGDEIVTAAGRRTKVVWLGHRRVDCRAHPRPHDVWPVRVQAGAFAPDQPLRDLWLSPDHAVLIGRALFPVRYLINGATIVQVPADHITYWHVELPQHDILLAEGLAAESYLDTGNRGAFANAAVVVKDDPDFALRTWERTACAPLVRSGARLAVERARLLARARALGYRQVRDPAPVADIGGRSVHPIRLGDTWRFALPPGTTTLELRSFSVVPAQIRRLHTDHRRLGVCVQHLAIDDEAIPLDDAALTAGWHPTESDGTLRWTDGAGRIDRRAPMRTMAMTLYLPLSYWAPVAASRSATTPVSGTLPRRSRPRARSAGV